MNRKQQSIGENRQVAEALNHYLSYEAEGTALVYSIDETAALSGEFGPDEEGDGVQSHTENGETSFTAGNHLSGQSGARSEEGGTESYEDDGDAGEGGDEDGEKLKIWEMEEDEDDLEDGKMVGALSYGDRHFAQASGLRF
ncbi:hypothetical protein Q7P35_003183 [Cladosporium inversicolor]